MLPLELPAEGRVGDIGIERHHPRVGGAERRQRRAVGHRAWPPCRPELVRSAPAAPVPAAARRRRHGAPAAAGWPVVAAPATSCAVPASASARSSSAPPGHQPCRATRRGPSINGHALALQRAGQDDRGAVRARAARLRQGIQQLADGRVRPPPGRATRRPASAARRPPCRGPTGLPGSARSR